MIDRLLRLITIMLLKRELGLILKTISEHRPNGLRDVWMGMAKDYIKALKVLKILNRVN